MTPRTTKQLDSRPSFIESLRTHSLGEPFELHVLNCRLVGMRAGERVVFEMRIRVPRTAPLGRDALTWMLAPATYDAPFAGGVILVSS